MRMPSMIDILLFYDLVYLVAKHLFGPIILGSFFFLGGGILIPEIVKLLF